MQLVETMWDRTENALNPRTKEKLSLWSGISLFRGIEMLHQLTGLLSFE